MGTDDDNGHPVKRKESDNEDDNAKGGLTIIYSGGEKCEYDDTAYNSLEIQMVCDNDKDQEAQFIRRDGCNYIVQVKDKQGCYYFDTNPFVRFFTNYSYAFGAFLIVLGFVVGLFGKPIFKPVICMIGTLVFLVAACFFIFTLFFTR